MKLIIFFIGLPYVLYRALREPVWCAMVAAYFYFAVPIREYYAPGAPYGAAFWALGIATCFRWRAIGSAEARSDLHRSAIESGRAAIEHIRGLLKETIYRAANQSISRGALRDEAKAAASQRAATLIEDETPAGLSLAVRRAVDQSITAAAEIAAGDAEQLVRSAADMPKGGLRLALETRVGPLIDRTLDEKLPALIEEQVERTIDEDERVKRKENRDAPHEGPLGVPVERGALSAVLGNAGLWLHVLFIALTFWGMRNAEYNPVAAANRLQVTLLLLLPMIGIICAVRSAKHFKLFVYAWMLGVLHLTYNCVTLWISMGGGGRADNIGGQGGEANFYAAITSTVAPVALSIAVASKKRSKRWFATFVAACFAVGIIASGSRGGLLALIGACGYWLMFTARKAKATGLAMLGIAGFLAVAPDSFWERMGTIVATADSNPWVRKESEPSKHEREILWSLAIEVFTENPWFGAGPDQYVAISGERTTITDAYQGQRGMMTHNSWLQMLSEYGVIGTLVWGGNLLGGMVWYFFARRRLRKFPEYAWFCGMALGLESGIIGCALANTFSSFQWMDYTYWIMVFAPLTYQIAQDTAAKAEWNSPGARTLKLPPPRYGAPTHGDITAIDLSATPVITTRS